MRERRVARYLRRPGRFLVAAGLCLGLAGCAGSEGDAGAGGPSTTADASPVETSSSTTEVASSPLTVVIDVLTSGENGQGRDGDQLGDACGGQGGGAGAYGYITQYASVTVRDGEGAVLGTEELGPGEITSITPTKDQWLCAWSVDMGSVPEVPFYDVEIAGNPVESFDAEDRQAHEDELVIVLQ